MFGQKTASPLARILKVALLLLVVIALNIVTTIGVVEAGSNNFSGWIVAQDAAGTTVAPPTSGFGFIRAAGGTSPTGPTIRIGTGAPNGVLSGAKGSEWIRTDSSGQHYFNTDGGTTWVLVTTS